MDAEEKGRVCLFAKPPLPGAVKTRLAASLGDEQAAALARAFLEDIWTQVTRLDWAVPILASTSGDARLFGLGKVELWQQGEGDLGARLERVLQTALASGPWAMAIGADSPALPMAYLREAKDALDRFDAVLGPTLDGGFYVLAVRTLPLGSLEGISWSTARTCAETEHRLKARGLSVGTLRPWHDVDVIEDLPALEADLAADPLIAPRTREALARLGPL